MKTRVFLLLGICPETKIREVSLRLNYPKFMPQLQTTLENEKKSQIQWMEEWIDILIHLNNSQKNYVPHCTSHIAFYSLKLTPNLWKLCHLYHWLNSVKTNIMQQSFKLGRGEGEGGIDSDVQSKT